jgi:CRP-like cAMP-binding protein
MRVKNGKTPTARYFNRIFLQNKLIYFCWGVFIAKSMYDSLIKYINSYISTPLNDSQVELLKNTFVPKKLKKRQYFLQEGQVCKYAAFIVKGAMRQYTVDDKGIEHIVHLLIENWWAVDRESFIMLTPSIYNIDAWEDTELLLFTRADYLNLLDPIPALGEMSRNLDDRNHIATQKRLNAAISLPAEQRYSNLVKAYPEFLQRFPQHIIASYLGITKETLSRIRSHAVKK